jgi:hypothetical protein
MDCAPWRGFALGLGPLRRLSGDITRNKKIVTHRPRSQPRLRSGALSTASSWAARRAESFRAAP